MDLAGEVITKRKAALGSVPILNDSKISEKLENFSNARSLKGMISLAASKLHVPATTFDAELYQLNVGNGVVDLRTGELVPHAPGQFNTKYSPILYDPEAESQMWHDAVMGIARGDEELYLFLQHLAGYAATGDVSAQRLYYFYGAGANGKSMFTDLIAEVLGGFDTTGYAVRLGNETILGRAERTAGTPSRPASRVSNKPFAVHPADGAAGVSQAQEQLQTFAVRHQAPGRANRGSCG